MEENEPSYKENDYEAGDSFNETKKETETPILQEKKQTNLKVYLLLGVLFVLIMTLVFGSFLLAQDPAQTGNIGIQNQPKIDQNAPTNLLSTKYPEFIDRTEYNFPIVQNFSYFRNLPKEPKDFYQMKELFERGRITALEVAPEYYKQPEFLLSWENWKKSYSQFENTIGTYGTGFYQAELWIDNLKPTETATASSFLFNGAKIQYYQGVSLDIDEASKKYFNVKITPNEVLLGTTYPEFSINPDWIYPIKFEITPKSKTPAGNYSIDIKFKPVSEINTKEWFWTYKTAYLDRSNSPISVPINLRFHVKVTGGNT